MNPSNIDLSSCKKNVQTGSVVENTETTPEVDDTSKTVLTGVDSSTINGEQVEEFEERVESSEEENKAEQKAKEESEQIKEENKSKEEKKEESLPNGEYTEEKEEINKFLKEKILPEFAKMKTYGREGVTDLLLAYYIEGVVELMFGVANVPYYFDQCL